MKAPKSRTLRLGFLLTLACLALFSCLPAARASAPQVYVIHLDDTIQPVSQAFLTRAIAEANQHHAAAILIQINTPGGLLDSTRAMVHSILNSAAPVIIYVTPSGSRAASAGFFLLESADVAAMAPGTNTGAAHPVVEGAKVGKIMGQKILNDALAFLRSYVAQRGRNVDAAQQAVQQSKSYTPQEALQLHLIDLISPSDTALLNTLNGQTITRFDGSKQVLHTANAQLIPVTHTLREGIMDLLMNPNFAVLILITGGLLIYLEFHIPGTIVPGALGILMVVLALFALNMLPVNATSWLLIIGALVLIVLETQFPSHGILAGAGTILLVLGLLTLVDGPIPQLRVQFATAAATGVAFGLITTVLVRAAWKARRNKSITGPNAMVGAIGIAQEPIAPRGQILIRGELWFAESAQPIPAGAHVKVSAVRGLTLLVNAETTELPS
jgi:membrane-bound serine protease (ClpP class)